ncbi:hypothetical protein DSN97_10575 [Deferribacteraceae bacterium V6Fe1]|nr:hypothetical protein DSN97_10575 [Deferribacteraceae bacterium V6Fe1]
MTNRFYILFLIITFFLFANGVLFAGHLYLNAGYDLQLQQYGYSDNQTQKTESNQLDNLFLETSFNRDFYGRRLGSIDLDAKVNKYDLGFYNDDMRIRTPFYKSDSESDTFYNVKSKLRFNIPKYKVSMSFEHYANKETKIDNDLYFNSLSKINADVSELEGIIKSLGDYQKSSTTNYYFFKPGNLTLMSNYTVYDYKNTTDNASYLKNETNLSTGAGIKNIFDIYYESNKKDYVYSSDNEEKDVYKLGFVDVFGNSVNYKLGNFKIGGYGEKIKEFYKGGYYKSRHLFADLGYEKGVNSLKNNFSYKYDEGKYTNDIKEGYFYDFAYNYNTVDLPAYIKVSVGKEKVYLSDIDNTYNYSEISNLLSSGLKGSGSILISNTGNGSVTIDLTGINIDGSNAVLGQIVLNSGGQYTISFGSTIDGVINVNSGDANDLEFSINNLSLGSYERKIVGGSTGYFLNWSEYFKNRMDINYISYNYTVTDDPRGNLDYNDEYIFSAEDRFEIRPYIYIFDKTLRYSHNDYDNEFYDELLFESKDGYYTLNKKFYINSKYQTRNGNGYEKRDKYEFMLYSEVLGKNGKFSFFPLYSKEKEENNYTKTLNSIELLLNYKVNSLRAFYSKEIYEYTNSSEKTKNTIRDLNYQLNARNIIGELKYRAYDYEQSVETYSANIKLIKYKYFPTVSPYLIAEFGFERDRDDSLGSFKNDDYFKFKLTYQPTTRLESIFSYEKELDKSSNKGDDYEFIAKYYTRVFRLAIGYRKNITVENDIRRTEDVVYFKISKNFDYYYKSRN